METLETRYHQIHSRIPAHATLIAVSKRHPIESIERLYNLGHRDFGENYVQELIDKNESARDLRLKDIRWHFIGHLQTNKVKALIPFVHAIHTIDSLRLANELSNRIQNLSRSPVSVFVQVNIDEEATKSGVLPETSGKFCEEIAGLPGFQSGSLKLEGLMTIPDPQKNPELAFMKMKALEAQCRPHTHGLLSMGMTHDFEIAVQNGATHVRIGTAIFGERN